MRNRGLIVHCYHLPLKNKNESRMSFTLCTLWQATRFWQISNGVINKWQLMINVFQDTYTKRWKIIALSVFVFPGCLYFFHVVLDKIINSKVSISCVEMEDVSMGWIGASESCWLFSHVTFWHRVRHHVLVPRDPWEM